MYIYPAHRRGWITELQVFFASSENANFDIVFHMVRWKVSEGSKEAKHSTGKLTLC